MKSMDEFADTAMQKMSLKDRRSITSPENGRAGGRKHIPVDEWARRFVAARYSEDLNGKPFSTLRIHVRDWYCYAGGYWHKLDRDDLESELVGFLQKSEFAENDRISKSAKEDILMNLKSNEICSLNSVKFRIPCFLPSGKSAAGWMPLENCVLNIEQAALALESGLPVPTDAVRALSPELFSTFGLPYSFDEKADCPKFKKYLFEIQPDEENRKVLQMLAGLSLVPDCKYNVAFFLYGEGGTGKSVFLNTLAALVGRENTCVVPLAKLADRFGLAPLTEKLLNVVGDLPVMPESGRISEVEGIFKEITDGATIRVERKGVEDWCAKATARMIFATNTMPQFTDRSNGVWDRVRIIPFDQRFRNTDRQNPNLSTELLEELPGIFVWALRGLAMLRKEKIFPECKAGKMLKDELRSDCDHERTFLQEHTEAATGSWCSSDELFKVYREWMLNNGYRAVGAANFKKAVKRLYPDSFDDNRRVDGQRMRRYWNFRMKPDF